MPPVTVSTAIDTFLKTANNPAALDALGLGTAVINVRTAFKTDTQVSTSVAAGTGVDITGLSIAHSLAESANKVILLCYVGIANTSIDIGNIGLSLLAGSTALNIGDTAGTRVRVNSAWLGSAVANFSGFPLFAIAEHSPGSTSSVTYKAVAANITGATSTLYINRTLEDGDNSGRPRAASCLVLIEVRV